MVRIFLIGATGFVGNPIAIALRRQGHQVYALARDEPKAIELTKQETIPILGDVNEPEKWTPVLNLVDIIIDASPSGYGISDSILKSIKESSRITSAKRQHPKLGYIYVSGIWVHGDSSDLTTDRMPVVLDAVVKPAGVVSWRPKFEDDLLDSRNVLDVAILRAGVLFGGSGRLCDVWWKPLVGALKTNKLTQPITISGNPEATIALIHKDDYAEAVLAAVNKFEVVSQIGYPIFDIVGSQERLDDLNKAAAKVLQITGEIKYEKPNDPFIEAMSTSIIVDTNRSTTYLDWQPKHTSLIRNAEVYVKAYLFFTDYNSAPAQK